MLLGHDPKYHVEEERASEWQQLPRHRDEGQVELDVNRSFIYYPKGTPSGCDCILKGYETANARSDECESQLYDRKTELSRVITKVLREHPMLCYFQGFHDVVQVLLLVLGIDQAGEAIAHLSLLRIRDFMLPSLSPSLAHLHLLPSILYSADPELCKHLSQTEPFFALAATLTLYAHEIQEYGDIARLFDFLLAHGAVVSVYFFAVIILSRREELFRIPANEPEMLHSILSKLPKPLDLEALIQQTTALVIEHPPERLPFRAWARISSYSVLKTTAGPIRKQSLRDGEKLFAKQVMQLKRQELRQQATTTIWKYRRPAGRVGLAIIVGLVSFWLRRSGLEGTPTLGLKKIWDFVRLFTER